MRRRGYREPKKLSVRWDVQAYATKATLKVGFRGYWGEASMWIPNDEGGLSEYDTINKHVLPHHLTRWALLASEESDMRSTLSVSTDDMREILWRVTRRKAAEPENLPGCALKTSTQQLTVNNWCYYCHFQHVTLKGNRFHPLLDNHHHACSQNVYSVLSGKWQTFTSQLVQTLTSLLFELHTQTGFCCPALHLQYTHCDNNNTHARMLFVNISSAFKTIFP